VVGRSGTGRRCVGANDAARSVPTWLKPSARTQIDAPRTTSVPVPPMVSMRTPPMRLPIGIKPQEHHPLAVAAIGHRARHRTHDEVRAGVERANHPHRDAGPGEREHQERQGRRIDRVAGRRHALADEQRPEVSVAAERLVAGWLGARGHSSKYRATSSIIATIMQRRAELGSKIVSILRKGSCA
jgi:hypothetical protein